MIVLCEATISSSPECSVTFPWRRGCRRTTRYGPSVSLWMRSSGRWPRLRRYVRADRPAFGSAGAPAPGGAAADLLLGAERTDADGTDELQPAVPLVCRSGTG